MSPTKVTIEYPATGWDRWKEQVTRTLLAYNYEVETVESLEYINPCWTVTGGVEDSRNNAEILLSITMDIHLLNVAG